MPAIMSWAPLKRLLVPAGLLIGALVLLRRVPDLHPGHLQLLEWLPYLSLCAVLALCAFFGRSRLFTAALGLLIVYWLVRSELQASLADPRAFLVFSLISAAVPIGALLLLLVPERGLLNRHGALVVGIVPAMMLYGWWVLAHPDGAAAEAMRLWLPVKLLPGMITAVWVAAGYLFAAMMALAVLLRRDSETAAALFSVLVFAFLMFALFDRPQVSGTMLGAAGLCLLASVVRRAHDMAFRDDLTGLLGRRALNQRMKSPGGTYAIAMLDVDHFKKLNDTWGHAVGDDVLKLVAKRIGEVGGRGTAYRYGGEEFSIFFPGGSIEECEPLLEEIREDIEQYRLAVRDRAHRSKSAQEAKERRGRRRRPRSEFVTVTISIGIAERNDELRTPQEVLKAADAALYRAKQSGRNRLAHA
jgi:diguanylate cyclase (GGDEF)-like protein